MKFCVQRGLGIPHISDSDMVELAGQVLGKLETMSDAEFTEVALEAAE